MKEMPTIRQHPKSIAIIIILQTYRAAGCCWVTLQELGLRIKKIWKVMTIRLIESMLHGRCRILISTWYRAPLFDMNSGLLDYVSCDYHRSNTKMPNAASTPFGSKPVPLFTSFVTLRVYWMKITTGMVIFITRNKMCYNGITKPIN